jgi:hypothetical protein
LKSGQKYVEVLNQEQDVVRVSEIGKNIERLYGEMKSDEVIYNRIIETKRDQIRRLAQYYKQQIENDCCFDKNKNKITSTHHICRIIIDEMTDRGFTGDTKVEVYRTLGDDYKRAWRQPVTNNGKVGMPTLEMDAELQTYYEEKMKIVDSLDNFDYNELPKPLKMLFAEKVYDLYKYHDKQWTHHGLHIVKHPQDDFSNLDPFSEIVSIEKGEPYEGELYEVYTELRKVVTEMCKKIKHDLKDENGERRITLEQEHMFANGVRVFIGYLKPHSNYKWKRDLFGWSRILGKRMELKSKSGAAKFSRKPVEIAELDIKTWRGITREEIDKNQNRLYKYFGQFIEHFGSLIIFHQIFETISEPIRAEHSVKLHEKLSNRA